MWSIPVILERTMETSKMLSGKQRVEEPRLRERGVGILEGLNLEQIMAEHAEHFELFGQEIKTIKLRGVRAYKCPQSSLDIFGGDA